MPTPKNNNPLKQLAILTGVAIQMGVIIYLFVLLGKWLDLKYSNQGKIFLIIFTLLGVAISLYLVVKQLNSIDKK